MREYWKIFLTTPAKHDLAQIHAYTSEAWGVAASNRYTALIEFALKNLTEDPKRFATFDAGNIRFGLRAYPLRLIRQKSAQVKIARPKHVIYFQIINPPLIEILRILHERMEVSDKLS